MKPKNNKNKTIDKLVSSARSAATKSISEWFHQQIGIRFSRVHRIGKSLVSAARHYEWIFLTDDFCERFEGCVQLFILIYKMNL